MKLHRFLFYFDITAKQISIDDKELVNQITKVLRLKKGEEVVLFDGRLNEVRCKIIDFRGQVIEVEVLESYQNENEPSKKLTLYCAVLKKENFELVVQKATEVGVNEIVPIITNRTVKLQLRQDRLEKIIKEAAEQSGRGIVPVLHPVMHFEDALKAAQKNDANVLFDSRGQELPLSVLDKTSIGIFIGPEGGWTEDELQMAKNANMDIVSLGKLTLRAETAAILTSYLLTSQ